MARDGATIATNRLSIEYPTIFDLPISSVISRRVRFSARGSTVERFPRALKRTLRSWEPFSGHGFVTHVGDIPIKQSHRKLRSLLASRRSHGLKTRATGDVLGLPSASA